MIRGYGILENLNIAELNMIQDQKQKMQEEMFALESQAEHYNMLRGSRPSYDTTERVKQVEAEFD
jgi:hypothetical protein